MPPGITVVGDPDHPEDPKQADAQLQQLWEMTISELAKIEEDPDHPLHAKAKLVGAEMMAPFAKALRASTAPTRAALTNNLGEWARTALKPLYDASGHVSKAYEPGILRMGEEMAKALRPTLAPDAKVGPSDILEAPEVVVDFTADEPPADVTVAQVHDAAQAQVVETLAGMFKTAQEQLAHLRTRAEADDERDKRQQKRERFLDARHFDTSRMSRWGVIGGWAAAGLTAIALAMQVIASITPEQ